MSGHMGVVRRTTENLRIIEKSLAYLREKGRRVIYDAEHFFDGYRADPAYAVETLKAAARGGAEAMVKDGLFEKFPCEQIFGMHNRPKLDVGKFAIRPGPQMACCRYRLPVSPSHLAAPSVIQEW